MASTRFLLQRKRGTPQRPPFYQRLWENRSAVHIAVTTVLIAGILFVVFAGTVVVRVRVVSHHSTSSDRRRPRCRLIVQRQGEKARGK